MYNFIRASKLVGLILGEEKKPEVNHFGSNSFDDAEVSHTHLWISAIIVIAAFLFAAHIESITN